MPREAEWLQYLSQCCEIAHWEEYTKWKTLIPLTNLWMATRACTLPVDKYPIRESWRKQRQSNLNGCIGEKNLLNDWRHEWLSNCFISFLFADHPSYVIWYTKKLIWEPSMETSHMLRTLITDPQQYYSASLRCCATAGKHVTHLPLACHCHYTSLVTQKHVAQPIARLHVVGYFCIIPRLYKRDTWKPSRLGESQMRQ
jgi:hypothetical protein